MSGLGDLWVEISVCAMKGRYATLTGDADTAATRTAMIAMIERRGYMVKRTEKDMVG